MCLGPGVSSLFADDANIFARTPRVLTAAFPVSAQRSAFAHDKKRSLGSTIKLLLPIIEVAPVAVGGFPDKGSRLGIQPLSVSDIYSHGLLLLSIAVAVVQIGRQNGYMLFVGDDTIPLSMLRPDGKDMVQKVRICFPVPRE